MLKPSGGFFKKVFGRLGKTRTGLTNPASKAFPRKPMDTKSPVPKSGGIFGRARSRKLEAE